MVQVALFFGVRHGIGDDTQGVTMPITKVLFLSRMVLLLLIVLNFAAALALDSDLRMSQYAHTSWRLQDGVFNGIPTAIVQTTDGYLWIGTTSGLMRFDGVRFVPWTPQPEGPAQANSVYSLGASRDGSLWIGSSILMRWKDGKLSSYPNVNGRVNAILEDPAGGVWVVRSRVSDGRGPLCHISDDRVQCFGNRDGISTRQAVTLFRDMSGTLWLGSPGSLTRGKPGSFETLALPALKALENLTGVSAFADGPNQSMLIGMAQSGPNMGLQEFKAGHLISFVRDGLDGSALQVNNLLSDRSGSLWIGTIGQGLRVVRDRRVDVVVAAIKASIGHPNTADLWQATQRATTAAELEAAIQPVLGESGLMQFAEFDHGIVRKGTEQRTSKIIRLVIGNPLIMKEMAKRVPDAGSYAPVTVLVDERADGVHISYDRVASLLAPYVNRDVLSVARDLDAKVEDVLRQAAA